MANSHGIEDLEHVLYGIQASLQNLSISGKQTVSSKELVQPILEYMKRSNGSNSSKIDSFIKKLENLSKNNASIPDAKVLAKALKENSSVNQSVINLKTLVLGIQSDLSQLNLRNSEENNVLRVTSALMKAYYKTSNDSQDKLLKEVSKTSVTQIKKLELIQKAIEQGIPAGDFKKLMRLQEDKSSLPVGIMAKIADYGLGKIGIKGKPVSGALSYYRGALRGENLLGKLLPYLPGTTAHKQAKGEAEANKLNVLRGKYTREVEGAKTRQKAAHGATQTSLEKKDQYFENLMKNLEILAKSEKSNIKDNNGIVDKNGKILDRDNLKQKIASGKLDLSTIFGDSKLQGKVAKNFFANYGIDPDSDTAVSSFKEKHNQNRAALEADVQKNRKIEAQETLNLGKASENLLGVEQKQRDFIREKSAEEIKQNTKANKKAYGRDKEMAKIASQEDAYKILQKNEESIKDDNFANPDSGIAKILARSDTSALEGKQLEDMEKYKRTVNEFVTDNEGVELVDNTLAKLGVGETKEEPHLKPGTGGDSDGDSDGGSNRFKNAREHGEGLLLGQEKETESVPMGIIEQEEEEQEEAEEQKIDLSKVLEALSGQKSSTEKSSKELQTILKEEMGKLINAIDELKDSLGSVPSEMKEVS